MSRVWLPGALALGLVVFGSGESLAGPDAVRFWILPFDNAAQDAQRAQLSSALPELLTVFVSASGGTLVEREHLDRILAEHALGAGGLVAPARRGRIGRLLGATAMITGSYAREGRGLIVTARVTDIASSRVVASAQVVGNEDRLGEAVRELHRELSAALRDARWGPIGTRPDPAPLQNLHFMRGLDLFYAGRHAQALAEFIQCGDGGLPALWRANCHLAREEYDEAYLELARLKREGLVTVDGAEVERKIERCRAHVPSPDMELYERLVMGSSKRPPGKPHRQPSAPPDGAGR